MKAVNEKSAKVLESFFNMAIKSDNHIKLDNAPGIYQPLVIERIEENQLSLCHYGEMNGDPMRDPEMVFYRVDAKNWYPIYFRNDYIGQEIFAAKIVGKSIEYHKKLQADQVSVAELWISNLIEQQNIKDDDNA
jgi:hypothetical protein